MYAVAAYILFGIWNIIDKTALDYITPIPYTMIKQFVGAISLFLYAHYFLENTHISSAKKHIGIISILGIMLGLSGLLVTQAFLSAPNP